MCGILVSVQSHLEVSELIVENGKRGPDAQNTLDIIMNGQLLKFYGFVLGLRGPLTKQPLGNTEFCLLFNGEIYGGIEVGIENNDSQNLYNSLSRAENEEQFLDIISLIEGEWAICCIFKNKLYFGRDFLGRRSLLLKHLDSDGFTISSVSDGEGGWNEVLANGIYSYDGKNIDLLEWNKVHGLSCPNLNPNLQKLHQLDIIEYPIVESDLEGYFKFDFESQSTNFRYNACQQLKGKLMQEVSKRVINIPRQAKPRLAILFSGGVDCMVLAALAHQCLPNEPVDLLNVAFENPRTSSKLPNSEIYNVPDRLTARQGHQELMNSCKRTWNLVEIDVPYKEYLEHKEYVAKLIYPLHSIMDLSIAIAFWFASRGQGTLNNMEYISTARVLLSGLGADEQLGGYSRHRSAYWKGGWSNLGKELELDISRISTRNLGRDDRIISSHGKEVRFPFLDRNVLELLLKMPVYYKTDPRLEREIGDKLLIRMLAYELGLKKTAREAKRAVQFGAKTAKMELNSQSSRGHDSI